MRGAAGAIGRRPAGPAAAGSRCCPHAEPCGCALQDAARSRARPASARPHGSAAGLTAAEKLCAPAARTARLGSVWLGSAGRLSGSAARRAGPEVRRARGWREALGQAVEEPRGGGGIFTGIPAAPSPRFPSRYSLSFSACRPAWAGSLVLPPAPVRLGAAAGGTPGAAALVALFSRGMRIAQDVPAWARGQRRERGWPREGSGTPTWCWGMRLELRAPFEASGVGSGSSGGRQLCGFCVGSAVLRVAAHAD